MEIGVFQSFERSDAFQRVEEEELLEEIDPACWCSGKESSKILFRLRLQLCKVVQFSHALPMHRSVSMRERVGKDSRN